MARLQISVSSCYLTVTVRGKANVTVCAFFGFSQLGGLGSQVGQITIALTFLVGVGDDLKCLPQGASDVVTPLSTLIHCSSAVSSTNLDDILVGATLMRVAVFGVFEQHVVHVGAGVLEQLVAAAEHNQRDLAVTQNAQLVRLLHQTELTLRERHLQAFQP